MDFFSSVAPFYSREYLRFSIQVLSYEHYNFDHNSRALYLAYTHIHIEYLCIKPETIFLGRFSSVLFLAKVIFAFVLGFLLVLACLIEFNVLLPCSMPPMNARNDIIWFYVRSIENTGSRGRSLRVCSGWPSGKKSWWVMMIDAHHQPPLHP